MSLRLASQNQHVPSTILKRFIHLFVQMDQEQQTLVIAIAEQFAAPPLGQPVRPVLFVVPPSRVVEQSSS